MTAEAPVEVRVARRFSAPPERVFDAWLDPEKAARFLSEEVDRVTIQIEPAEGGCELTLVHETSPQWADQSGEGWSMILGGLADALP